MSRLDQLQKKKLYTMVAVISVAAIYLMIFLFSADTGEESSGISSKIANLIWEIYCKIRGTERRLLTQTAIVPDRSPVSVIEAVIRKLAHFTEYFWVGALSYSIVLVWQKRKKKGAVLVAIQLVVSAGLDEFHQFFVPGRCASFKDVLIDASGGLTGMLLIFWLFVFINRVTLSPQDL